MNKHISNVSERFGPFQFAPSKTKLVPGQLDRYLNEMIPGFRQLSKRPRTQNRSINDDSTTGNTESVLAKGRSAQQVISIKIEPIDPIDVALDRMENDDENDQLHLEVGAPFQSELANTLVEVAKLRKENQFQLVQIAQRSKTIEELRSENEELKRRLQETKAEFVEKLKDAKKKEWCYNCLEPMGKKCTQLCKVCSMYQS